MDNTIVRMTQADSTIRNCISIDVEGFVESNLQSFPIENKYISKSREKYEIEKNIESVLSLLDEHDIKGTFFLLGRIGRDIPGVVKKTAECGHEIACHSYEHVRLFGLTRQEFKENMISAKKILEDVSGKEVCGFRAPEFSITKTTLWALDTLRETGFLYDSSVYPTGLHDVYGMKDAEPFIFKFPNGLLEFPLPIVDLFSLRFPFGGGGYFRLYPLLFTKYFIRQINRGGHPCMLYIHPYEIGPEIPYLPEISYYRRFRHYYNCKNGGERLREMFRSFRFAPAVELLKERNLLS
ncbi:MAG: DUF3473 domain-containing protein [Nitrospirae bacterium]|nr:DUF3473 domain-containing protein [Nitrospirota bacterium]